MDKQWTTLRTQERNHLDRHCACFQSQRSGSQEALEKFILTASASNWMKIATSRCCIGQWEQTDIVQVIKRKKQDFCSLIF
ncbi:MAG: hypothetical protein ACLSA6_14955 [Holdemania massiliensis]